MFNSSAALLACSTNAPSLVKRSWSRWSLTSLASLASTCSSLGRLGPLVAIVLGVYTPQYPIGLSTTFSGNIVADLHTIVNVALLPSIDAALLHSVDAALYPYIDIIRHPAINAAKTILIDLAFYPLLLPCYLSIDRTYVVSMHRTSTPNSRPSSNLVHGTILQCPYSLFDRGAWCEVEFFCCILHKWCPPLCHNSLQTCLHCGNIYELPCRILVY